ncbi:MAG: hypothetical protein FWG45_04215 [Oscillospiraceae bacterium]|nr:hypothetical protein [Oscillospiraceae bacterium]
MKDKLFGSNIKPACKYCDFGAPTDSGRINCTMFGEVKEDDMCKKFDYSPLKRIPVKGFTVTQA